MRLQMLVLILELLQLSWAECVEEVAKRKRIHASGSSVVDRGWMRVSVSAWAIAKKARAGAKRGPFRTAVPAPYPIVHAAETTCHARRELPLRSLLTRHSQLCGVSTQPHTQAQARAQT